MTVPSNESNFHRVWITNYEDRIKERLSQGYEFVIQDGQKIDRKGSVKQYLMEVPRGQWESLWSTKVAPDTAYLSYVPKINQPLSQKIEGNDPELILESPTGHIGFFEWKWSKHAWFARVSPGKPLYAYFNYYKGPDFFRLIFRPTRDWTLYFRIRWNPSWKIDLIPESRKKFELNWAIPKGGK